jgi:signal transduction histidine kinase
VAASLTSARDAVSSTTDPVNVLLVDDQPARLLVYRAILDPLGENLIEARSGTDALREVMASDCAVILLDVNMPGMDGFETASLIHQHPRFERTPIIFVTAVNVSDLDRVRGYKLGAFDYVTVPIIPEILRSKVMVLCELHRKRRDLQLANQHLAAANQALGIEKARDLAVLNDSLSALNTALASRNAELQAEVAERESAEAALLDLSRRKDEFLATLAHELRNPLAALSNAINVFKLAAGGDEALHRSLQRQLGVLVRLIDDLLDAARISRGKLALKRVPTTLKAVLDSAIETVTPLLDASSHRVLVRIPPEPIALHADQERLAQVFSNLLANAVKYSDAGTSIALEASRDGDRLSVSVEDHGIGLTADQFDRIFEPFTQLDTSVERSRGGLGIGLSLARHIVEMHAGTIAVQSAGPGMGSRFTVRLPLSASDLPAESASPAVPEAKPEVVRRRALIIDDNEDSADTLAMMLQLLGHDTRCLYDPRRTHDTVSAFDPDIVFLDIGMPGLSGHDVARSLRSTPLGNRLVIVAVTGWGQPEERRRTAEAGFDHHLVKPVDMETIRRICEAVGVR